MGTIVGNGSTFGSSLVRSVLVFPITCNSPSPFTDWFRVYDRGTPFVTEIGVGKAIKGWDEGRVYYIPQTSLSPLLIIADMIRRLTANGGI